MRLRLFNSKNKIKINKEYISKRNKPLKKSFKKSVDV